MRPVLQVGIDRDRSEFSSTGCSTATFSRNPASGADVMESETTPVVGTYASIVATPTGCLCSPAWAVFSHSR